MTRSFLGLGSNLGDRLALLRSAVVSLGDDVQAVSDVYETEPVGGPDQGPFLNIVVEISTDLTPVELLDLCHRLEADAGRVRNERWGPRTLDVDILWIGGAVVDSPDLQVPHARMFERMFVLAPLSELAPELLPDGWQECAAGSVVRRGPLA